MLEAELRNNREVLISAARNAKRKQSRAGRVKYNRFKGAERPYDDRNIDDLAILLIKEQGETEEERNAYFDAEVEKLIDAFEGKADIKPYIKALYDSLAISENINWCDPEQVERIYATIKVNQAVATMYSDFKKETLELYPTHTEKQNIDAKIGASGMLYFIFCDALLETDFSAQIDEIIQIGLNPRAPLITNTTLVKKDACSDIFEANVKGETDVIIDPFRSENSKKFFMGQRIALNDADGTSFTEDDYAMNYIRWLAQSGRETSFEQRLNNEAFEGDPDLDFGYDSLLFINGKPFFEISKELNNFKPKGDTLAGYKLREALTDGKSVVTLIRSSYTSDGKVKFYHQDIKVDLDKINEADRKETKYNFFRRFLDKIGIWKIQKFPSNKERDEKQDKIRNDPKYSNAIRDAENNLMKFYNGLKPRADRDMLRNIITNISRLDEHAEKQLGEQKIDINTNREPMPSIDLTKEEIKIPVEPPKSTDEKVLKSETIAK